MPRFSRPLLLGVLTAVLPCGFGSVASADPSFEVTWWVNENEVGTYHLNGGGTYNPVQDWWNYQAAGLTDPATNTTMSYSLNVDDDSNWYGTNAVPRFSSLIGGNMTVKNLDVNPIDVKLLVLLPVLYPQPNATLLMGSAALGLTADPGGAGALDAPNGDYLWKGLLDGVPAGASSSLFFDLNLPAGAGLSANSFGNFGNPVPLAGGPMLNTIGVQIEFTLTPGDQASITSVFSVIPAPGGLLVLAAGVLGLRRRRRA